MPETLHLPVYMNYLVPRKNNSHKAHLWDESVYDVQGDTYCKMFSTGGLSKKKYIVADKPLGHEICSMCNAVYQKLTGDKISPIQG
jgi:hypothetical protein